MDESIPNGRCINAGIAEGEALVTHQSFGFSHGIDPDTGVICDKMHEWLGQTAKGKVLVFPHGKGSSTGGLWILELVRLANAPAGVINQITDPVVAAGFIMAKVLYEVEIPVIDYPNQDPVEWIRTGDWVRLDAEQGIVIVEKKT